MTRDTGIYVKLVGGMHIFLMASILLTLGMTAWASPRNAAVVWPPLPSSGFISGRAATKHDIELGNAAFVLESGGKAEGRPLDIAIPQYGLLRDESTGAEIPVIVIQAESNGTIDVVGCVGIADKVVRVATLPELKLLGTDIHKLPPPDASRERSGEE